MAQPPQMSLQDLLGQINTTAEGIQGEKLAREKMSTELEKAKLGQTYKLHTRSTQDLRNERNDIDKQLGKGSFVDKANTRVNTIHNAMTNLMQGNSTADAAATLGEFLGANPQATRAIGTIVKNNPYFKKNFGGDLSQALNYAKNTTDSTLTKALRDTGMQFLGSQLDEAEREYKSGRRATEAGIEAPAHRESGIDITPTLQKHFAPIDETIQAARGLHKQYTSMKEEDKPESASEKLMGDIKSILPEILGGTPSKPSPKPQGIESLVTPSAPQPPAKQMSNLNQLRTNPPASTPPQPAGQVKVRHKQTGDVGFVSAQDAQDYSDIYDVVK